jgi:hypothetical protein
MKRAVACLDSAGSPVDASLCKGVPPVTTSICNPKPCPGHCLKAGCGDCANGFVGNFCEVSQQSSLSSLYSAVFMSSLTLMV